MIDMQRRLVKDAFEREAGVERLVASAHAAVEHHAAALSQASSALRLWAQCEAPNGRKSRTRSGKGKSKSRKT
ncbi:MAG: hypothetical protein QM722_23615 [Piscinibacter sp.]